MHAVIRHLVLCFTYMLYFLNNNNRTAWQTKSFTGSVAVIPILCSDRNKLPNLIVGWLASSLWLLLAASWIFQQCHTTYTSKFVTSMFSPVYSVELLFLDKHWCSSVRTSSETTMCPLSVCVPSIQNSEAIFPPWTGCFKGTTGSSHSLPCLCSEGCGVIVEHSREIDKQWILQGNRAIMIVYYHTQSQCQSVFFHIKITRSSTRDTTEQCKELKEAKLELSLCN